MFKSHTLAYYCYFAFINACLAANVNFDLHVVNKVIAPDGYARSAVLAGTTETNARLMGPLISGNKGDRFSINVVNSLNDDSMATSTSIHWHGIFQTGSNWADGPSGVSQCPILPGRSFLYEFNTFDQAGTFWYHSHLSTQYCDGLRGPFVVYDSEDPYLDLYDVDDESTIISLADWYHYFAPGAPPIPISNTTLINGLGRSSNGPLSPLAVVQVSRQKRYRFRLISMSCDPWFTFSIDQHDMTIIEVDGQNVFPLTVDSISVFAGQRYSFVLNATQPVGNYWVRSLPHNFNVTSNFTGNSNLAILRYRGADLADPATEDIPSTKPLLETDLHPLTKAGSPGSPSIRSADVSLNLNITLNRTDHRFAINGAHFIPPKTPILLQILSGAETAQDIMPVGSVYSLPPNKVIEVSIPGGSPGSPHPIHLHGHSFDVVRSAGSSHYNYENPVRRDVVSTGVAGDNVTIRFATDNAGPWLLHCHIDWHLEEGLAIVFAEDTETVAAERPPTAWKNLCPSDNAVQEHKGRLTY